MKKLFILFLFIFSFVFVVSCNDTPEVPVDSEVKDTLTISQSSKQMTVGDEYILTFTKKGNSITDTPIWSSSNTEVCTVNSEGLVTAYNKGECVVSVSIGKLTASCNVSVLTNGFLPTIVFDNYVRSSENILSGEDFNLGCHVEYNGKSFNDCTITYTTSANVDGFVTISDGLMTQELSEGTKFSVTAQASWRGFSSPLLSKTVEFTIVNDRVVSLNNGELNNIELYTVDNFSGQNFSTSCEFNSIVCLENGVECDIVSVDVEDTDIATINLNQNKHSGVIRSNKAGKTKLVVTYSTQTGNKTYDFEITVLKPYVKYSEVIKDYSANDGAYYDALSDQMVSLSSFFDDPLVSATQDGNDNITIVDGKVYGLVATSSITHAATVLCETEKVGISFDLIVYTQVFDDIKDFEQFYVNTTKQEKKVYGYYVLGKDLINPEYDICNAGVLGVTIFMATFDGRGHSITFKKENTDILNIYYSIFGSKFQGTIKNVALKDIVYRGDKWGTGVFGLDGYYEREGKEVVDNCYIEIKDYQFSGFQMNEVNNSGQNILFYSGGWSNLTISNCFVQIKKTTLISGEKQTYSLIGRGGALTVNNVFVVTNGTALDTTVGNVDGNMKNFKVYNSILLLQLSSNKYTSFNTEYWDLSRNYPVWK